MNLRLTLSLLTALFTLQGFSQVSISDFPKNRQLYPRNLKTGNGTVVVSGSVNEDDNFSHVNFKVFRNNELQKSTVEKLNFKTGLGKFKFNAPIKAELAEYRYELYAWKFGEEILIRKADSVVAGDAYLINGQSNSVANSRRDSAYGYENQYIRSFGTTMHDTTAGNDLNWYVAHGDGYSDSGEIGQWGLKTAHSIVTTQNIPVAVIAGGVGGTHLLQHLRSDTLPQLKTIYGRLLFRTNTAGLQNSIRAIWWHQGETDAYYKRTVDEYMTLWNTLKNQWMQDYPSVEQYFTFQIRQGCFSQSNYSVNVMEAQRRLASDSAHIHLIATNGTEQGEDYCHYPFKNGHEVFADRLTPQVLHYLYGAPKTDDLFSPDIVSAKLISPTLIELNFSNPELPIDIYPELYNDFKIENGGYNIRPESSYLLDNKVYLTVTEPITLPCSLSYLGHPGFTTPYIKRNGNAALSFGNFPLSE